MSITKSLNEGLLPILIIGVGNIGFRHLEGVMKSRRNIDISVCDVSDVALRNCERLISDKYLEAGSKSISYLNSIDKFSKEECLIIDATTANSRAERIVEIVAKLKPRFMVIEKVISQSTVEMDLIVEATKELKGCWVNYSRRMMPWHQEIRHKLASCGPLQVRKEGVGWGMACNSMHFIDLVQWWTGEEVDFIDTRNLSQSWFPAKRAGFYEVDGVITVNFSGGSTLTLVDSPFSVSNLITLSTASGEDFTIDEANGQFRKCDMPLLNGKIVLQSELSNLILEQIISQQEVELTSVEIAAPAHSKFIAALLAHRNKNMSELAKDIPIT